MSIQTPQNCDLHPLSSVLLTQMSTFPLPWTALRGLRQLPVQYPAGAQSLLSVMSVMSTIISARQALGP